jgi:hypothetical protein
MSNVLNKIHYAVEIDTGTTITDEAIGLYQGTIRFVTDNYDPSGASYENGSAVVHPTKWFHEFLTKNEGISNLNSTIDLTIGGDYAFLQSTEIEIVNATTDGDAYHTRVTDLFSHLITGSTMVIYVVIDDVFYERWHGSVTGTQLNDSKYVFIGEDSHNNDNDTLKGKTIGHVIGAEYTYLEVEPKPYANNIALRRFGPYVFGTPHIHAVGAGETGHPLAMFTGFSQGTIGDIQPTGVTWLQIEKNTASMAFMSLEVAVGDLISINGGDTYYEILSWDTYTGVSQSDSKVYHIHINVKYFDRSLFDYTACFTDPGEFLDTQEPFDGIAAMKGTALLSFYKKAAGTGIPASVVTGQYVTIVDSEGKFVNMTYTVLADGSIRLNDVVYTTTLKPLSVKLYKRQNDSIDFDLGAELPHESDFVQMTLANTMKAGDHFTNISGLEGFNSSNGHRCSLFKLQFPATALEQGDWNLGVMVQGIFNNQNVNWETLDPNAWGTGIGWYVCQESSNWNANPSLPVNKSKGITFGSAKGLAGAAFNNFRVKVYKIVTVYDGNTKKELLYNISEEFLPNVSNSTKLTANNTWDRLNLEVKSVVATNILNTDPDIYSTAKGIRHHSAYLTGSGTGMGGGYSSHYIQDELLDYGEAVKIDVVEFVVSIEGIDNDVSSTVDAGSKAVYLTDSTGLQTNFTTAIDEPVPYLNYNINGFSLFRTEAVNTNKSKISIVQNDITTNTYPTTLASIVGQTAIDTTQLIDRDDWITGMQIIDPVVRYNVVTGLCKQGFVAGFSSRKGVPTFVSFIESTKTPHEHDNDLIMRNSMKSFITTPISKVFNEFNVKWNYNNTTNKYISQISILNTKEKYFPPITEKWTDYVSGISDYNIAKYYWTLASKAYNVSKIINKAPNDRTDLKYAYDENVLEMGINKKYLSTDPLTVTLSPELSGGTLAIGSYIQFPYYNVLPDNFLSIGDTVYYDDGTNSMTLAIETDRVASSTPKWMCRVLTSTFASTITTLAMDATKAYLIVTEGDVLAGARLANPPANGGALNAKSITTVGNVSFKVGVTCNMPKADLPTTAIAGSIYRLSFVDSNEDYNCFADVKVISTHATNPLFWLVVVIGMQSVTSVQTYDNIFSYTAEASFLVVYYKSISVTDIVLSGYVKKYLDLLLKWTTYQKFQVTYDLPITAETIKYELVDRIKFKDPIITPNNTMGRGWITSLTFDTKNDKIRAKITFDPGFLVRPPIVIPQCVWIDEKSTNVDTIDEKSTNTNTIVEKHCSLGA